MKSRLILKSFQSPGDIVMLTAAVRDLHAAYPGRFQTDVRTSADAILARLVSRQDFPRFVAGLVRVDLANAHQQLKEQPA